MPRDPRAAVPSTASSEQLWWPPQKIVGDHLGPYLEALSSQELRLRRMSRQPLCLSGGVLFEALVGDAEG